MSRDSVWYAFVALLGGVGVALAAAMFPPRQRSGGEAGLGDDEGGDGTFSLPVPEGSPGSALEAPSFLAELVWILTLVAVLVALVYLVFHWREALARLLEGAAIAVVLFGLYILVSRLFSNQFDEGEFGFGDDPSLGGGGGGGGDQLVSTDPSSVFVLLVVALVLVLAVVAVVFGRGSDGGGSQDPPEEDDAESTTTAVGRAAGRTADRLEDATEAENEIYRAWAEMTRLVDSSNRETKTPAEFEGAAVDAGMDAGDVRDLTRLFERVRYGTEEPSETDEQRAVELFRRIESTYAGEES